MSSVPRDIQPLGLPRHEGYSRLTRGRMAGFLAARGRGAERGSLARGSRFDSEFSPVIGDAGGVNSIEGDGR